MKARLFIVTSMLVLSSNIFAKEVSVPFIHRAVPQEGLNIKYSLSGEYPQKLVCVFDNFYKGYLKYTENNMEKEALPFGMGDDAQEVYFTNKGQTWVRTQGLDNLEQFHVDARGMLSVKNASRRTSPYASCFYLPENTN